MQIVFASDAIEANGKTVRENNLAREHAIPLGTLVEIDADYLPEHGVRLFVVRHTRDCDGSPMYDLSFDPNVIAELEEIERDKDQYTECGMNWRIVQGEVTGRINRAWGEDSLIVIHRIKLSDG